MQEWFTADLHLFHKKICEYDNAPFQGTAERNKAIQQNINAVVKAEDWLYLLGDTAFGKPEWLAYWLDGLICKNLCVILGDHDKPTIQLATKEPKRFFWIKELTKISQVIEPRETDQNGHSKEQRIILCHYPLESWAQMHYGSWHLHGHSHGKIAPKGRRKDVGIAPCNYKPVSFSQLKTEFEKIPICAEGHHKPQNNNLST